ncbi:acyltransferase family protein, partial [Motilimonas sp. KMU-193]|uniref:acyltransferase family protein n=1 Tax=Motilimonas sp. KMU-193 TaxID=3388668 RepID=UPI00396B2E66
YPDMAFYLLPSRAWELLLGGLATFYNRERLSVAIEGSLEKLIYKTLPLLGLFLIAHSMLFVGHEVKHPSFLTLVPVIGTCLFLMFSHRGEASNDLLSIKPFVYIGLVSYSLYLWHQPVFVFFRFIKHDYFRYEQFVLLVIISLLLAVLTYIFVESVYRKKGLNRYVLSLPFITVLSLGFLVNQTIKYEGFPERLTGNIKEAYDMYKHIEFRRLEQPDRIGDSYRGQTQTRSQCNFRSVETACRFGDESWITLGDSFVGQYDYVLHEITQNKNEGMISLAYEQCPFVSPSIWFGNVPECSIVNERRLKLIANFDSAKKFIVAASYNQFFVPKARTQNPLEDGQKNFMGGNVLKTDVAWKSYAENINKLLNLGHEVYVVYPMPDPGTDVKKAVFQQLTTSMSKYKDMWSLNGNAY